MGANLARNIASKGFPVAGYDLSAEKRQSFVAGEPSGSNIVSADAPEKLMAVLERPRRVLMMVPAGAPVDSVIAHLRPHLEREDILIDGGNSFFKDTDRRCGRARLGGFPLRRHGGVGRRGRRAARTVDDAGRAARGVGGARAHPSRNGRESRGWRALRVVYGPARRRPLREDGAQRHRVRRHAADRRGVRRAHARGGNVRTRDCRHVLRRGTKES